MTTKNSTLKFPAANTRGKADPKSLTSEQIADHLAAFRKAGGTVEVLGVTRTLKHLGQPAAVVPATPAPAPARKRG